MRAGRASSLALRWSPTRVMACRWAQSAPASRTLRVELGRLGGVSSGAGRAAPGPAGNCSRQRALEDWPRKLVGVANCPLRAPLAAPRHKSDELPIAHWSFRAPPPRACLHSGEIATASAASILSPEARCGKRGSSLVACWASGRPRIVRSEPSDAYQRPDEFPCGGLGAASARPGYGFGAMNRSRSRSRPRKGHPDRPPRWGAPPRPANIQALRNPDSGPAQSRLSRNRGWMLLIVTADSANFLWPKAAQVWQRWGG